MNITDVTEAPAGLESLIIVMFFRRCHSLNDGSPQQGIKAVNKNNEYV